MSASSYNCKHPRGAMSIKAGTPPKTKVLSSGKAAHFVPRTPNKAFSTQGGTKK